MKKSIDAKTYLEKVKLDETYWGKKIIAAEKRGRFKESEGDQAAKWTTCACGNESYNIPRGPRYNEPLDEVLYDLGFRFSFIIEDNQFVNAAEMLFWIEERAMIVAKKFDEEQKKK
jgi:hypothetical protein